MHKPVTLLTGFLGAGKTTFLNHMLLTKPNVRYAIIENEFGEQGIDGDLIYRPEDGIVELNNGCLCCTLNDNLYDILNDLYDRRDEFDEIIVEATGVADPAGLAAPFLNHPQIKKHFPLRYTLCLVDAEHVEDQMQETEEALNQITFSDILLLNKTDLVTSGYASELKSMLHLLNPLAKIMDGNKEHFPALSALEGSDEDFNKRITKLAEADIPRTELHLKSTGHHHHHSHTPDLVSFCFTFDQPFDQQMFQHHLFVYLTFQSKGLYRIKGLVSMDNNDHQMVIQSVGTRLSVEEKRRWEADEDRRSVIVFIGKGLHEEGLRNLLKKCLVRDLKSKNHITA